MCSETSSNPTYKKHGYQSRDKKYHIVWQKPLIFSITISDTTLKQGKFLLILMSDSTINLAALGRFMLYGGRFETTVLARHTSRATSPSHSRFYIPGIREFGSAGASVTQLSSKEAEHLADHKLHMKQICLKQTAQAVSRRTFF
jgi:hypothetical protein